MSNSTLNLRPLADRIVVEAQQAASQTPGGIYIPDSAGKDSPVEGKVLAVGTGRCVDGKIQPLQIKVGERVLFGKYAGTNVKLNQKEYLVMREEDIIGVID